ncbi:hypothetical protein Tco_1236747 [Tanacetum coccineum]
MATRYFMKPVNNDNSTNVYEPFENRDYLEGHHCDKNFLYVTNLKQPFIQSKCFSLVNKLLFSIYPHHIQEFYVKYYFDIPSLTLRFRMYGYGYAWNLRKLERVLNVSSKGTLFFTISIDTKAWVDVLMSNMFIEIEAQESLPTIVDHMLYCIKTNTPFNFAYLIARRLSGLEYNNETLPYARVWTTLFKYLKNKHPNDAFRKIEVDEVTPMCPPFTMKSLEFKNIMVE